LARIIEGKHKILKDTKTDVFHLNCPMPREFVQDSVYGCIILEPHECDVIDTRAFQRLRKIKQLQSVHLVYPGASHTRFEHSLGAMHIAGYFAENLLEPMVDNRELTHEDKDRYVRLVRLWALLHDLGHGPFSHAFDRIVLHNAGTDHEKIGARIMTEDEDLLAIFERTQRQLGISAQDVAMSQADYEQVEDKMKPVERALLHVLKGAYNADVTDYLLRDSYHAGTPEYGQVSWQRLYLTSSIRDDKIVLESRSRSALESFYVSRHQMYSTVYYHRTARAADKMIEHILARSRASLSKYIENSKQYLDLNEEALLNDLKKRRGHTGRLVQEYMRRKIPWKMAYQKPIRVDEPSIINMMTSEDYGKSVKRRISELCEPEDINIFVDGTYLRESPLSPVAGEAEVPLFYPKENAIEQWSAPKFFGEGSYTFWVRVYYHEDCEALENRITEASKTIFEQVVPGDKTTW